ncbi:MAG: helix-turn-helix domain-containing protein [Chloroflexota bacterium]
MSDTARIRQFLSQRFSDSELEEFCFDYFPAVHRNFSQGMPRKNKIQLLLEHCRNHSKMAQLLNTLEQIRTHQVQFELGDLLGRMEELPPQQASAIQPVFSKFKKWGEALKAYRQTAGLSQLALGKRVGVDYSLIARWEKGQRTIPKTRVTHLALLKVFAENHVLADCNEAQAFLKLADMRALTETEYKRYLASHVQWPYLLA